MAEPLENIAPEDPFEVQVHRLRALVAEYVQDFRRLTTLSDEQAAALREQTAELDRLRAAVVAAAAIGADAGGRRLAAALDLAARAIDVADGLAEDALEYGDSRPVVEQLRAELAALRAQ